MPIIMNTVGTTIKIMMISGCHENDDGGSGCGGDYDVGIEYNDDDSDGESDDHGANGDENEKEKNYDHYENEECGGCAD